MCTDVPGTAATAPSEAVFVTRGCGSVWGQGGAGPEQECCGGGAHLLPRCRCHVSILSAQVNALENRFSSKRQVAQGPLRQLELEEEDLAQGRPAWAPRWRGLGCPSNTFYLASENEHFYCVSHPVLTLVCCLIFISSIMFQEIT